MNADYSNVGISSGEEDEEDARRMINFGRRSRALHAGSRTINEGVGGGPKRSWSLVLRCNNDYSLGDVSVALVRVRQGRVRRVRAVSRQAVGAIGRQRRGDDGRAVRRDQRGADDRTRGGCGCGCRRGRGRGECQEDEEAELRNMLRNQKRNVALEEV